MDLLVARDAMAVERKAFNQCLSRNDGDGRKTEEEEAAPGTRQTVITSALNISLYWKGTRKRLQKKRKYQHRRSKMIMQLQTNIQRLSVPFPNCKQHTKLLLLVRHD